MTLTQQTVGRVKDSEGTQRLLATEISYFLWEYATVWGPWSPGRSRNLTKGYLVGTLASGEMSPRFLSPPPFQSSLVPASG
jgi:hypothetical protein